MTQPNLTQDAPIQLGPEETAAAVTDLAADRKALGIVQLDLRGMIGYADYFVICSGRTDRQTRAIHDAIHEGMKARGVLPGRVEGLSEAKWILMDYLDVVVHVFTPDTREYYRLEQLWGEAPSLSVEAEAAAG
ncbi:MAG TPA: ribosome silencing factor [Solirubrobacteraceae bacterium]|nr:ribosome silencing factor [Solirubrobacteraceae bacterium]